jgi:hypothetical protein
VNWTGSAFVNAEKSDFHHLLQPLVMVQIGAGKARGETGDRPAARRRPQFEGRAGRELRQSWQRQP